MKTGRIIVWLMGLLGFGVTQVSCIMYGPPAPAEYGMPHANFEVKGRVVDEDGDPIRDIKIVVTDAGNGGHEGSEVGVGLTDSRGSYTVSGSWFGHSPLTVSVEDIDGEENGGEFAEKEQVFNLKPSDYVGGDGWYEGKVTKTADFTLTLKPQEGESE